MSQLSEHLLGRGAIATQRVSKMQDRDAVHQAAYDLLVSQHGIPRTSILSPSRFLAVTEYFNLLLSLERDNGYCKQLYKAVGKVRRQRSMFVSSFGVGVGLESGRIGSRVRRIGLGRVREKVTRGNSA